MNDQLGPRALELTMLPINTQLPARAARAHALKNCLAIVCAVNRLVEADLATEAAQLRLARSQKAVRRMAELIEEDLRIDAAAADGEARGREDMKRRGEYVATERVFEAVRLRTEDLAAARRVHLELRVGPGGVWGDFAALVEALGNIVKNAVESSHAGEAVRVRSAIGVEGGQLWSVRDTGPGIPRHVLAQLGTPFLSRKKGGSGLGIAVARQVFEGHGGLLHIESAPGWGTMVSMWIPLLPTTDVE